MKQIRCKPGDLALVIYDIPGCIKNVGRLVRVRGALKLNRIYQLQCWLVHPVSPEPWYVDYYSEVRLWKSFVNRNLEHPDDWLLPVRPHARGMGAEQILGLSASDNRAVAARHVLGRADALQATKGAEFR